MQKDNASWTDESQTNNARAVRLWNSARKIYGTPAAVYLVNRGILPKGENTDALRYLEEGGERMLLGAVRAWNNGQPGDVVAIQRIYLTPTGEKVKGSAKLSLGTMADAAGNPAFWLMPGVEPAVVCEGIEDALAVRMAYFTKAQRPPTVVATLGVGRFAAAAKAFPGAVFLPDAEAEAIAKAHAAAHACKGKVVLLANVAGADGCGDANELLAGAGPDAVLQAIAEAVEPVAPVSRDEDGGQEKLPLSARATAARGMSDKLSDVRNESRPEDIERALHAYWDADNYDDWATAALALHKFPDGKVIWWTWAQRSHKFDAAQNHQKWNQCQPTSNISARSILGRVPRSVLSEWGREHAAANREKADEFPIDPEAEAAMQAARARQQHGTGSGGAGSDGTGQGGQQKAGTGNQQSGGKQAPARDFAWKTAETSPGPVLNGHWIIKKFLPQEGLAVMFGRPGCGKSFVALDIMLTVANGFRWRGYKTKQVSVSYIASEGGTMGTNRVHAWMRENSLPWPTGLRISPVALDLCSTIADRNALIDDIRVNQPNCGLVVIDTLNRNMAGGDENSSEDMGAFVGHCDAIAKALKCLVLIIHHSGKDETKGSRGHSSLLGAISTEFEVTRKEGEAAKLKVTKQRDAEDGQEFGFVLKSVLLGLDDDGDEVRSAVVVSADAPEVTASPGGKVQRAVQAAFIQFSLDHGEPNPGGTGFPEAGRVKVVDLEAFVTFAAGRMASKSESQARKDVRRAINGLVNRGCLALNAGKLWFLI